MSTNAHNPDQYMASLRQIIAQGRKRIGLLVGAGAPVGIPSPDEAGPLIPAVAGLTKQVLETLDKEYGQTLNLIQGEIENPNIETILTRVRSLSSVIGDTEVHGINGKGYKELSDKICEKIGKIVDQTLPDGVTPYSNIVNWISGTDRDHPIEIFTTNYDRLFEQALEQAKTPFFDGFTGSCEPFFDPSSVASNDLPPRWVRVWKIHGSIGWTNNSAGEVIRSSQNHATHLIYPEHQKYDQTQKAPYSALFDRLRAFLMTPDSLLISTGFSFADAHISALIDECLAANPSASVFAFQFQQLTKETHACDIASRRSNMSVYSHDMAMINGIRAEWRTGESPSKDWGPIRAGYWGASIEGEAPKFLLGSFDKLAHFFASSRSTQVYHIPVKESQEASEVETSNEQ